MPDHTRGHPHLPGCGTPLPLFAISTRDPTEAQSHPFKAGGSHTLEGSRQKGVILSGRNKVHQAEGVDKAHQNARLSHVLKASALSKLLYSARPSTPLKPGHTFNGMESIKPSRLHGQAAYQIHVISATPGAMCAALGLIKAAAAAGPGQVRYGSMRWSSASLRPLSTGTPGASIWPSRRQMPGPTPSA